MRILKFQLLEHGVTSFATKDKPRILSVGVDGNDKLCVWVEAEVGFEYSTTLYSAFTGDNVPYSQGEAYIGTVGLYKNEIIVHVYLLISQAELDAYRERVALL